MKAIVLAGGRLRGPLARHAPTKAQLPLAGRTLLDLVLGALRQCAKVEEVVVLADPRASPPDGARTLAASGEGWENALRGLEAVAAEEACLLCACDMPFVTGVALESFLAACSPGVALSYPLVSREAFQRSFPGLGRRFVPTRQGHLTGGSAMVVHPGRILGIRERLAQVFAARRNTLRIAAMLGPGFLLRRLAGTLEVSDVEARLRSLTGLECRGVLEAPPELAVDVDTEADYRFVLARMSEDAAGASWNDGR